jgi:hypothetical protein
VSASPPYSPPHFSHLQSIGPMSSQSQHSNITQFSASMHATQNFPISPRKLHRGHTPILPPPLPSVASNRIAPLATGANDDIASLFCFYNVMALLPQSGGLNCFFRPASFPMTAVAPIRLGVATHHFLRGGLRLLCGLCTKEYLKY